MADASDADEDRDAGLSLSLTGHLAELRSRLIHVLLGIVLLGCASLAFSREIFRFLMAPVLRALPDGSQSLIYTSGIEELNVLLKVGLYAGLFLSVPLILREAWQFAAPGLLKSEKRFLLPFVTLGTLFFLLGAAFCYQAVLPSMFAFLLSPSETAGEMAPKVRRAEALLDDAVRLWRVGEDSRAREMAERSERDFPPQPNSAESPAREPPAPEEAEALLERQGQLLDAASTRLLVLGGERARMKLRAALESRMKSRILLESSGLKSSDARRDAMAALSDSLSQISEAFAALELQKEDPSEASSPAGRPLPTEAQSALSALWSAHQQLARANSDLARAAWTRPMLTMKEQLSLVLVLELAFGFIFELPLIMAALALLGLLRFRWVWKAQRYAIVGCVVVSAFITPTGDLINLSLMAVPMILCFEVGVLLVFLLERRAQKESAAAENGEETG